MGNSQSHSGPSGPYRNGVPVAKPVARHYWATSSKGWSKEAPRGIERKRMLQRCGRSCFLKPPTGYPICTKHSCDVNCKGIEAAYMRARQMHDAAVTGRAIRKAASHCGAQKWHSMGRKLKNGNESDEEEEEEELFFDAQECFSDDNCPPEEKCVKGECRGLEERNKYGETLLHQAVSKGDEGAVKALISEGANLDTLNKWGDTPLVTATGTANEEIANILINAGADLNMGRQPPLIQAVMRGRDGIAQDLIDYGADVDIVNYLGDTPLSWAVENTNEGIAEELIMAGAAPVLDKSGKSKYTLSFRTQWLQQRKRAADNRINEELRKRFVKWAGITE